MSNETTAATERNDLAVVLRRLAVDVAFRQSVQADPRRSLQSYRLTAADLGALAVWLDADEPRRGMHELFDGAADERDSR